MATRWEWETNNLNREFWEQPTLPAPKGGFAEKGPPLDDEIAPVDACSGREEIAARVRDALRELRLKKDHGILPDVDMGVIVDQIVLVGTSRAPSDVRPASFRVNGRANARRELDEAAKLVEKAIKKIKGWHQPAIVALGDRGVMRHKVESFLGVEAKHVVQP